MRGFFLLNANIQPPDRLLKHKKPVPPGGGATDPAEMQRKFVNEIRDSSMGRAHLTFGTLVSAE
jgi:hypothetical protein